jgi:hypothetical protein
MSRLGGVLTFALGLVLMISGLVGGNGATAGEIIPQCGGGAEAGAIVPTTCTVGTLVITKELVGTGPVPAGGWVVTITSTNCVLPVLSDDTVTLPAAGGSASSDPLYQFSGPPRVNATPCEYTLAETAVAGWTPSFSPDGPYVLPQTATDPSELSVALTNTAVVTTTTPVPPPSTTPPLTTAPVTTTPATTVAVSDPGTTTPAPSPSASPALAATGARRVGPQVLIGALLCLIGLGLVLTSRRRGARI